MVYEAVLQISTHTQRTHHNLDLIMPHVSVIYFINTNILIFTKHHPQSFTLHLHIDKEAIGQRVWNKYCVSSACARSELKLAQTFWPQQQKCLFKNRPWWVTTPPGGQNSLTFRIENCTKSLQDWVVQQDWSNFLSIKVVIGKKRLFPLTFTQYEKLSVDSESFPELYS